MGQKPVPPVNIPIPTKLGSKMGGAPTPKGDPIGFDPQPHANQEYEKWKEENNNGRGWHLKYYKGLLLTSFCTISCLLLSTSRVRIGDFNNSRGQGILQQHQRAALEFVACLPPLQIRTCLFFLRTTVCPSSTLGRRMKRLLIWPSTRREQMTARTWDGDARKLMGVYSMSMCVCVSFLEFVQVALKVNQRNIKLRPYYDTYPHARQHKFTTTHRSWQEWINEADDEEFVDHSKDQLFQCNLHS